MASADRIPLPQGAVSVNGMSEKNRVSMISEQEEGTMSPRWGKDPGNGKQNRDLNVCHHPQGKLNKS